MKWQMTQIGSVAEVSSGDSAPQEASAFGANGTPFIRAGSLSTLLDGAPENELELIPVHESSRRRMRTYPPQTIVFAKSGMSCTKGLIYEVKNPAHVVSHLAALECGDNLDNRFLLRWFEVNPPSRLIANPSYPSIKISDIRSVKIPLPPLDEQMRIAAILDAADALRAKRRQSIAQLDALIQSTFLDLFGDPVTNPIHPTRCIAEIVSRIIDYRGKSPEKTSEGIPLITAKIVKKKGIDKPNEFIAETAYDSWMRRGIPSPQDVIITTEAPMGEVALVPDYKAAFAQRLLVLQPKREILEPIYLMWALTMPFVTRQMDQRATGSTVTGIRSKEFRKVEVPLPPLSLQQKFAAIVESIESQKTTQRTHLAELDDLFAALQHRAFRGEL
jgi:type I restriction enzyme S subunit